jgi:toxin FitB
MYLLDTNVISELRRVKPHGAVVAWISGVDDAELHVAAVTIGELQAGIEITRTQDAAKADSLEARSDVVASSYNLQPMDARVFRQWAKLMHGKSDSLINDAMIAATAQCHGLTVVTRNIRDFKPFGVATLNPFQTRG